MKNTIVNWIDQKWNESFDELWTCIEMLLHYDMLEIEQVVEEYNESEIGQGANIYCFLHIK